MSRPSPLPELGPLTEVLTRRLARAWPAASAQAVEDAVQDAIVVLWLRSARGEVARPESFAWRVAWRRLRAGWRGRRLLPELREPAGGDPWGGVELGLDVETCLRRRLGAFPAHHRPALRRALEERVHGGRDTEIAADHGVQREYLNRLRSALRRDLGPPS